MSMNDGASNAELLKKVDPERYFAEYLSVGVYPDGWLFFIL